MYVVKPIDAFNPSRLWRDETSSRFSGRATRPPLQDQLLDSLSSLFGLEPLFAGHCFCPARELFFKKNNPRTLVFCRVDFVFVVKPQSGPKVLCLANIGMRSRVIYQNVCNKAHWRLQSVPLLAGRDLVPFFGTGHSATSPDSPPNLWKSPRKSNEETRGSLPSFTNSMSKD